MFSVSARKSRLCGARVGGLQSSHRDDEVKVFDLRPSSGICARRSSREDGDAHLAQARQQFVQFAEADERVSPTLDR